MSHATAEDRAFPFDPALVTGLRMDGTATVASVLPGTGHVVVAAGETWFRWEQDGVRRAVNCRHIAEAFAKRPAPLVIDLTDPANEFMRDLSRLQLGRIS